MKRSSLRAREQYRCIRRAGDAGKSYKPRIIYSQTLQVMRRHVDPHYVLPADAQIISDADPIKPDVNEPTMDPDTPRAKFIRLTHEAQRLRQKLDSIYASRLVGTKHEIKEAFPGAWNSSAKLELDLRLLDKQIARMQEECGFDCST